MIGARPGSTAQAFALPCGRCRHSIEDVGKWPGTAATGCHGLLCHCHLLCPSAGAVASTCQLWVVIGIGLPLVSESRHRPAVAVPYCSEGMGCGTKAS